MDGCGQGCTGSFLNLTSLLASVKGHGWQHLWLPPALRDWGVIYCTHTLPTLPGPQTSQSASDQCRSKAEDSLPCPVPAGQQEARVPTVRAGAERGPCLQPSLPTGHFWGGRHRSRMVSAETEPSDSACPFSLVLNQRLHTLSSQRRTSTGSRSKNNRYLKEQETLSQQPVTQHWAGAGNV